MYVTAVVGNPKIGSKTSRAATAVQQAIRAWLLERGVATEPAHFELGVMGPNLVEWGHPSVQETINVLQQSIVIIFCSPTYKATYAGLLKLLIDQIPVNGLADIVAIPVMLGAAPIHHLAPELTLKPVLLEVGAICPTRSLYILDSEIDRLEQTVAQWLETSAAGLGVVMASQLLSTRK